MLPAFLSQPSLTRRLLLTTLVPLVMAFALLLILLTMQLATAAIRPRAEAKAPASPGC